MKPKRRLLLMLAVCLVATSLLAFATPVATIPPPPAQQLGPLVEMPLPEPLARWAPDGVISPGEYTSEADFGSFEIHWTNYYQYFYAAITARTDGWVALGIPPESGAGNTDIIYGAITDGKATVVDMFTSSGDISQRRPDTEPGGANNVHAFGGGIQYGNITIEFRRALSTADAYDRQFSFPLTRIIWAYGSGDKVAGQGDAELGLLFFACPEYIC